MATTIIISAVTCITMIVFVLVKPTIRIKKFHVSSYWVIALFGAILLLATNSISLDKVWQGLTANASINPLKILVLFLSMSVLSIFLDEIGFFAYLAQVTLKKARSSQFTLFLYLYLLVSLLTVFTSNDIIVLTFTPFICYFAKNAKINPLPYLVTEFVAANTWSLLFIIGNPTNIYLATTYNINFIEYFKVMAIPTIFGGVVSFIMLLLLFSKSLKAPLDISEMEYSHITDKGLLFIGIIHLGICTIMLIISSYINIDMWLITLCFALSLFICVLIYKAVKKQKPRELLRTFVRAPWELIPFVISMFIIVMSLSEQGVTNSINVILGETNTIFRYGITSTLVSNLINNIPMSVLYCSVAKPLADANIYKAVFSSIVGSDIGALVTPIGSLAGIMWNGILRDQKVEYSFGRFTLNGIIIATPTLFAILFGLTLILG